MKARPPKELVTHFAIAKAMRDFVRDDWLWTHVASGEERTKEVGRKLKNMGLKPGWSDFVLAAPGGRMHAMEVERWHRESELLKEQREFRDHCLLHGIPHAIVIDVAEALDVLGTWGALRIRFVGQDRVPDLAEAGA